MALKLEQLRYFVAVADEGQVTRGAAKLHMAQPALSQSIAQLESELEIQLFERHARGVTLTAAGRAFYKKATVALAATEDAALTAKALGRAASGTIAFGFIGTPPQLHYPALLDAVAARHPDVVLGYHELRFPSGSTNSWLGEVDVAFCHLPPSDPDIWVRVLRREPRVLLVHKSHPLAKKRKLGLSEVLDQTFIGLHSSVAPWWRGFWSLDDHRGGPPLDETDDRAAVSQELFGAIASGRAVTTVPAFQAALIAQVITDVVAIPLVDAEPAALGLAGRKDHLNEVVRALIEDAESNPPGPPGA
jgi:DNA-binding transcriptional LysR family regulator